MATSAACICWGCELTVDCVTWWEPHENSGRQEWVVTVSLSSVSWCKGILLGSPFCSVGLCVCRHASITLLDYCSFVVSFEIRSANSLLFLLLFKPVLAIWGPLRFRINSRISATAWLNDTVPRAHSGIQKCGFSLMLCISSTKPTDQQFTLLLLILHPFDEQKFHIPWR